MPNVRGGHLGHRTLDTASHSLSYLTITVAYAVVTTNSGSIPVIFDPQWVNRRSNSKKSTLGRVVVVVLTLFNKTPDFPQETKEATRNWH